MSENKYSIEEVFDLLGEKALSMNAMPQNKNARHESVTVNNHLIYVHSLRYMTFFQCGVQCVECGKKATHFRLIESKNSNRAHFELFDDDGLLFTKDHILPKSAGGQDIVSNLQTMCVNCNAQKGGCQKKANTWIVKKPVNPAMKTVYYPSIESAICDCLSRQPARKKLVEQVSRTIQFYQRITDALEKDTEFFGCHWTIESMETKTFDNNS